MKKRNLTKNIYEKKNRDFYRKMDRMKRKPIVEYKLPAEQMGQEEWRKNG